MTAFQIFNIILVILQNLHFTAEVIVVVVRSTQKIEIYEVEIYTACLPHKRKFAKKKMLKSPLKITMQIIIIYFLSLFIAIQLKMYLFILYFTLKKAFRK